MLAPRDCACAPAWEEKCRLGENLESGVQALASGTGENWWEGCAGIGPGGWHTMHCAHASSLGEPLSPAKERSPHKVTVRSRAAVSFPPSLPSFFRSQSPSFLPSFFSSLFPLFTLPFSPYSPSPSFPPASLPHSLRRHHTPQCSKLDAPAGRDSAPAPQEPSA